MGRKKQNPEESAKRLLILQAAGKMFMSQGFGSVSMDAIAGAAPVSKRTLYNHFTDKKSLFTAVMQRRCQDLFAQLEQSLHEKQDAKQALTLIGQQFLGVVLEPDAVNFYRIAITESQHFPELGVLFYESGPKRSHGLLSEYIRKLHEKQILHAPQPELAAGAFLSMLLGRMQMQRLLGVKKQVSAKERNAMVVYAVDAFLHGHAAR